MSGLSLTRSSVHGLMIATTLGQLATSTAHSAFGEPLEWRAQFDGTDLLAFEYGYDALSRITDKVETIGGAAAAYRYTYDTAGRLAEVHLDDLLVESYQYDANGNRVSATTAPGTFNGAYDARTGWSLTAMPLCGRGAGADADLSDELRPAAFSGRWASGGSLRWPRSGLIHPGAFNRGTILITALEFGPRKQGFFVR